MTNKEILQADLLDIIFERRNKDYGAYALRKYYNKRMLTAVGSAMSLILLFFMINGFSHNNNNNGIVNYTQDDKSHVVITEVVFQKDKPQEPLKPKEPVKSKPVEKMAQQKVTSTIRIRPDDLVKNTMVDVKSLDDRKVADVSGEGKKDDGIPKETGKPGISNAGDAGINTEAQGPEFKPMETDPEFPGGPEALKRFLAKNLNTPGELEAGEKKMVQIRFNVDKDGIVSTLEILASGGSEFDNEVERVCKKMPHWIPAIQNGVNVPVSYVLPVTFIGVEQ